MTKANPKPANKPILRNRKGQLVKGSGTLNPLGRASSGESWGEVFKRIFAMTPADLSDYASEISKRIQKYGKGNITVKEMVALRVADALLFDPQANLLNAVMDRAEGKVTQPLSFENELTAWLRDHADTLRADPAERARVLRVLAEGGHDAAALFASVGVSVEVTEDADLHP